MAALTIFCPQCNASLKVPASAPELIKCKCPKCGATFQAVKPTSPVEADAPEAAQRPVPRPRAAGSTAGSSRWLLVGGAVALVGLSSICCIGVVVVGWIGWQDKGAGPNLAIVIPKQAVGDADWEPIGKPPITPPIPPKTDVPTPSKPVIPDVVPKQPEEPPPTGEGTVRSRIPFSAIGTRQRLEQVKIVQIKGKIRFTAATNVNDVSVTWESLKRLKYDEKVGFSDSIILLIGNHGWMTSGANNRTLQGDGLGFYQNFNYATILSNLITLTEEGFDIETGDSGPVRGKTCYSVLVKRVGRPSLKMFFEKETNLLYKADFVGKFLDQNLNFAPRTTFVEFYFSNYEVVDGINHWRKQEQWRDGKKYSDFDLSEVRFLNKVDDALFVVPRLQADVQRALAGDKRDAIKKVVTRLGPGAGSDFARLVKGLSHSDAALRPVARDALVTYVGFWRATQAPPFERADVAALVALLRPGEDVDLQSFAVEGVGRLGPQAMEAASPLVNIVKEARDTKLLAAALAALRAVGVKNEETLATFERNLDHAEVSVKDAAAVALLQLGPDRLQINRLIELMSRPSDEVRTGADKLLRQKLVAVTRKDLPPLRQGLKNPVREVRLAFIDAIGSLKEDGRDALPDLLPLLGSPDHAVSVQAVRAVDSMGKLADVVATNSEPALVTAGLAGLRAKGAKTEDALTAYEKHLDHAEAGVRNLAALALLELGPDRLPVDRLTELMARPNEEVRKGADKLLRMKLAAVTAKDLPGLRKGLKSNIREVRLAFVDAIGSLKEQGQDAAGDLADLLPAADKDAALQTIRVLEGMGKAGAKAGPLLAKSMESQDKPVAMAATLAMCKIEPAHPALKTVGVNVLVGDLNPDIADLAAFIARPLGSKSSAALLDIGEPAVAPMVKHLITRYTVKASAENRLAGPTAARLMGYELMKEFAKRAKAMDDKKLIIALKKQETNLRAAWEPQEANLASLAKQNPAIPLQTRQLYVAAADAAYHAHKAVASLRNP